MLNQHCWTSTSWFDINLKAFGGEASAILIQGNLYEAHDCPNATDDGGDADGDIFNQVFKS